MRIVLALLSFLAVAACDKRNVTWTVPVGPDGTCKPPAEAKPGDKVTCR